MISSVTSISTSAFALSPNQNRGNKEAALRGEEEKEPFSSTESGVANGQKSEKKKPQAANPNKLTEEEQKQVEELKKRDQEVRTHEAAHLAAAGELAKGGPTFTFQTGPDGRHYAIGGSVQIDTSKGRTPEETITKAQRIRAAALAVAEPSPQDVKVASQASRMEAEAAAELQKERAEEAEEAAENRESAEPANGETAAANAFTSFDPDGNEKKDGESDREAFASLVRNAYASSESGFASTFSVSA